MPCVLEAVGDRTMLGRPRARRCARTVSLPLGETTDPRHDVTFVVKPVMDDQELQAGVVTAVSDVRTRPVAATKRRTPLWFRVAYVGTSLPHLSDLVHALRQWTRRRRTSAFGLTLFQTRPGYLT